MITKVTIIANTRRILSNLKYIPGIIFTLKNWVVFCLTYGGIISAKNTTYLLRDGIEIQTKELIDVSTIAVIFIKKNYGKMPDKSVIVDIGANIGAFAIYAVSTSEDSLVYAYEPEISNYELLCRNLQANNLEQKIRAYNLGVSSKRQKRKLFLNDSLSHSVYSQNKDASSVEIDCISLDDVFESNSLDRIDLLKIDCEGAEFEILYGVSSGCLEKIREIRMEYHNQSGENNVRHLIEFLQGRGKNVVFFRPDSDRCGNIWFS